MQLSEFVNHIAVAQSWPLRVDASGEIRVEVSTQPGRTQIVHVMQGADAEQEPMVYLWSIAGDFGAARDLQHLMRFSMRLSYGAVAIKDGWIVVKHSIRLAAADEVTLRKSIFYVGRAADMLEAEASGAQDRQ
jgi:hypothetical protein